MQPEQPAGSDGLDSTGRTQDIAGTNRQENPSTKISHGGFYKHFESKDELLIESLRHAFRQISERLAEAAEQSRPDTAWKAIVKAYLSPEDCAHTERGCPLAALAPELARADKTMKAQIFGELTKYKTRILPFMPGQRNADREHAFL